MTTKGRKAAKKSGGSRKKSDAPKAAKPGPERQSPDALTGDSCSSASDAEQYTRGVLIRGEAAYPSPDGTLPPDATHAIVGEDERGMPVIREHRKKAY